MGDLILIGIGVILCILFKKYDDAQKAKIRKAEEKLAKKEKNKAGQTDVAALAAQVEELTKILKEQMKKSPTE